LHADGFILVLLLLMHMRRYLQGAAHYVSADKQQHDEEHPSSKHHAETAAAADAASSAGGHLQAGAHLVSPQGLAVQIICSCDEIPDEGVEVLVLRGLLTATTSLAFTLHGQALLLAVRTCYNIHLMSRSEVNQTTAKATLTQMLNVVFQRMEAGSVKIAVSAAAWA
jgi:brefeldin A-inhibited guanine nucleotide-exchange protein